VCCVKKYKFNIYLLLYNILKDNKLNIKYINLKLKYINFVTSIYYNFIIILFYYLILL